ncbi:hypothetical protein ACN42_g6517 [Penicillium freii]|uniref:Uncharacterized protein n=1 Tax=Penicillium freii TaxID=48697 RepID=A0A101MHQ4_PENFR|nr:hypothetical protein ACN42_g6517 [Penicillium freii]
MPDTAEGSPPPPSRRQRSQPQYALDEESTFDYVFDRRNGTDIKDTVPKLKGESNWSSWEHHLYMTLKKNNTAYIKIIPEENTRPAPPVYLDITESTVRQAALLKMNGYPALLPMSLFEN